MPVDFFIVKPPTRLLAVFVIVDWCDVLAVAVIDWSACFARALIPNIISTQKSYRKKYEEIRIKMRPLWLSIIWVYLVPVVQHACLCSS